MVIVIYATYYSGKLLGIFANPFSAFQLVTIDSNVLLLIYLHEGTIGKAVASRSSQHRLPKMNALFLQLFSILLLKKFFNVNI